MNSSITLIEKFDTYVDNLQIMSSLDAILSDLYSPSVFFEKAFEINKEQIIQSSSTIEKHNLDDESYDLKNSELIILLIRFFLDSSSDVKQNPLQDLNHFVWYCKEQYTQGKQQLHNQKQSCCGVYQALGKICALSDGQVEDMLKELLSKITKFMGSSNFFALTCHYLEAKCNFKADFLRLNLESLATYLSHFPNMPYKLRQSALWANKLFSNTALLVVPRCIFNQALDIAQQGRSFAKKSIDNKKQLLNLSSDSLSCSYALANLPLISIMPHNANYATFCVDKAHQDYEHAVKIHVQSLLPISCYKVKSGSTYGDKQLAGLVICDPNHPIANIDDLHKYAQMEQKETLSLITEPFFNSSNEALSYIDKIADKLNFCHIVDVEVLNHIKFMTRGRPSKRDKELAIDKPVFKVRAKVIQDDRHLALLEERCNYRPLSLLEPVAFEQRFKDDEELVNNYYFYAMQNFTLEKWLQKKDSAEFFQDNSIDSNLPLGALAAIMLLSSAFFMHLSDE